MIDRETQQAINLQGQKIADLVGRVEALEKALTGKSSHTAHKPSSATTSPATSGKSS